jgi:hypothetical protein
MRRGTASRRRKRKRRPFEVRRPFSLHIRDKIINDILQIISLTIILLQISQNPDLTNLGTVIMMTKRPLAIS